MAPRAVGSRGRGVGAAPPLKPIIWFGRRGRDPRPSGRCTDQAGREQVAAGSRQRDLTVGRDLAGPQQREPPGKAVTHFEGRGHLLVP